MCHVHSRLDNMGVVVITDKEYPSRTAFTIIGKVKQKKEKKKS